MTTENDKDQIKFSLSLPFLLGTLRLRPISIEQKRSDIASGGQN